MPLNDWLSNFVIYDANYLYCWIFPFCSQILDICYGDGSTRLYARYLPATVRHITAFAREVPHFTELVLDDQRILIKSSILEVAVVHDSPYIELDADKWVDHRLRFSISRDYYEHLGILGDVFAEMHRAMLKIQKLELTDVELSLITALILLCPGWY